MANHSQFRRRFDRTVGYRLEAAAVAVFMALMRVLPVETASNLVGGLMRRLGPRLGASKKALRNIGHSFPGMPEAERRRVLAEAWENFGRTMAEYVHLRRIFDRFEEHVELVGKEHITALATDGRPGVAITGHFGNWEMAGLTCARLGLELTFVYRAPNNPWVDRWLAEARAPLGGRMVPKGRLAAKELVATMRAGGHIGLLVDQKLNEGIPVPFLGRDAMTGTVMADMALRYDAPVVPVRVTRLKGTRFRVQAFPPLAIARTGDLKADTAAAMRQVNDIMSDWVRDDPGQWLWQHRRWPDERVPDTGPADGPKPGTTDSQRP